MSSNVKNLEAIRPVDPVTSVSVPAFELNATHHDRVQAEMKVIKSKIIPLELLEKKLAIQYGTAQDFDSVEIFGRTKRLAIANRDHRFVQDLQNLGRLNDLRLQLTELRHSHTVSPPTNG
ncbi:hypothetical protein ARMGADRAFT_1013543 [Armillaria gallica]|uniref:Nas2 N-terminal domain-containing protein n=1 Tax=Armillaria gallica TaxID=47427 RepID=A0A2H3D953_ARMGA|nr:hypothetical protein ARMGADRAFT_1013543 [Armillaria gallica]